MATFQVPFGPVALERGWSVTRVAAGAAEGWAHLLFDLRGENLFDFRVHQHIGVRLGGTRARLDNAGTDGSLQHQQAHAAVKLGRGRTLTIEYFASSDDAEPTATETFEITKEQRRPRR